MPPRRRYTADLIHDAAVELVRAQGVEALSARSLAAHMGCSTGPIFTSFATMEALVEQLMDGVVAAFVERASREAHPDPLVSAGLGWLGFAVEEPRLYEALFLRPSPGFGPALTRKWGPVRRRLAARMGEHPRYADLDEAARFALVGRASVILHGLGLELWSGRLRAGSPLERQRLVEQLVLPAVDAAMDRGWTADFHSTPSPEPRPS